MKKLTFFHKSFTQDPYDAHKQPRRYLMSRTEYIVSVDTKGMKRAVILNADNELSAARKALSLFKNVELIKVEKFEKKLLAA
jgi:hypothetical protein